MLYFLAADAFLCSGHSCTTVALAPVRISYSVDDVILGVVPSGDVRFVGTACFRLKSVRLDVLGGFMNTFFKRTHLKRQVEVNIGQGNTGNAAIPSVGHL